MHIPTLLSLLSLLSLRPWHRRLVPLRGRTRPAVAWLEDPAPETDERPLGCGWFDSSHELNHGLVVHEHATPDTLAAELPLANWIELHLAGWRAAGSLEGMPLATEASSRP